MSEDRLNDEQGIESPGEDRAGETRLLLEYVRDRDAFCPRCGYNLRNLTRPVCPECEETLSLRVDILQVSLGWLVVTLAPSIFSGICGLMLFTLIVIFPGEEAGVWLLDSFGLTSGAAGVVLFLSRDRFVRSRRRVQVRWAMLTWFIHLAAFALLVALVD